MVALAFFLAILLFAGPKEELKARAVFLVFFLSIVLLLLWASAPEQFEADVRDLFSMVRDDR
jgi:hypothetical protein